MEACVKAMYESLRQHESFDFGPYEELTPGQRAYLGGAFMDSLRLLRQLYAAHSRLKDNWIEEVARQLELDV